MLGLFLTTTLAMQTNCSARNAPILVYGSLFVLVILTNYENEQTFGHQLNSD